MKKPNPKSSVFLQYFVSFFVLLNMKTNIRTLDTIKFFRGKERDNKEMQRLSDEKRDFEYRRLLIEENELDLHVAYSRMLVWRWFAWFFLGFGVIFIQNPIVFYVLIGFGIISEFFSYINKKYFQFVMRSYNLALSIVDSVIFTEYGISFK